MIESTLCFYLSTYQKMISHEKRIWHFFASFLLLDVLIFIFLCFLSFLKFVENWTRSEGHVSALCNEHLIFAVVALQRMCCALYFAKNEEKWWWSRTGKLHEHHDGNDIMITMSSSFAKNILQRRLCNGRFVLRL